MTFTTMTKDIYVALPTFIFMAAVLEISGLGNALFEMMYKWMAGLRGGLAMGVIGISTVLAAMTGSSATATIMMGMIAYPEMEKRGYDKRIMIGSISAGGSLGPLIPPSIPMIVVASITTVSIGKLFVAGLIPGLIAALGYITYIGLKCWKNPEMGPAIPKEERVGWTDKLKSLRLAGLPILVILLVLGLIYFKITAMLMWLVITGGAFSQLIGVIGVQSYVQDFLLALSVSPRLIVIGILGLVFILGMFIETTAITVIFLPIFYPIVMELGFDPLWFGLLFIIDLMTGIMTPPFGMILFYFKGLNIPGVTMMDIYRDIIPFVVVMVAVMLLVFFVPETGTWLPNMMIK